MQIVSKVLPQQESYSEVTSRAKIAEESGAQILMTMNPVAPFPGISEVLQYLITAKVLRLRLISGLIMNLVVILLQPVNAP